VQRPFDLNDGSEVRLTISRYYTPSGRSIQKPYEDLDAYDKDITSRYKHGEFFTADSIKFKDSLKYSTAHGRTVYGGGGIMPDYFVPLDTVNTSRYFNDLYFANVVREFALNFAEENKETLKQKGFDSFVKNFEVTEAMVKKLMAMGEKEKIKPDLRDLKKHKKVFHLSLKAEIARRIWGNQNFYPVFNETNEVLQQAIKLFDKVPELDRSKM
jgi:carboxyl-terminal processing protease